MGMGEPVALPRLDPPPELFRYLFSIEQSMSPNGPGLCENTLLIIAQGKVSRKGKSLSNAEEGRYLFDHILVAVGSRLVQEGERKQSRTDYIAKGSGPFPSRKARKPRVQAYRPSQF
jgi:hypothetical protein